MGCQHSTGAVLAQEPAGASASASGPARRPAAGPRESEGEEAASTIHFQKRPGDRLGLGIGSTGCGGAVVFNVKPGCMLESHNLQAPENLRLFAGCIILSVNQRSGYWNIFEELTTHGSFEICFTQKPPRGSSRSWFQDIETFGKDMEARGGSFMLRLNSEENSTTTAYSSVPSVRAADVGVDQCSICLEDVPPDVQLMQLPCGHCFHMLCAGRWLTEGKRRLCRQQRCPLCCQRVGEASDRCGARSTETAAAAEDGAPRSGVPPPPPPPPPTRA